MVVGQACEQGFEPEKKNIQFGFYFLKDTTKTIEDIFDEDIKTLELKDEPWISEKDIEFYDWSSHCIYLKKDKSYFFPGFESFTSDFLYKLSWVDRPLIVVANGKKCYASYFFGGLYSIDYWPYPDIFDFDIIHYPRDVIYAEWPYPFAKDLRSNEDVKNVLNIQGLLHEGLHITIDSLWIDNADTVTIRYKITVKNNDTDNLYILDPDKMGSDLFHYFNNGPIFYNSTNNIVYRSNYKKVTSPPLGTYEADWFTKIENN